MSDASAPILSNLLLVAILLAVGMVLLIAVKVAMLLYLRRLGQSHRITAQQVSQVGRKADALQEDLRLLALTATRYGQKLSAHDDILAKIEERLVRVESGTPTPSPGAESAAAPSPADERRPVDPAAYGRMVSTPLVENPRPKTPGAGTWLGGADGPMPLKPAG